MQAIPVAGPSITAHEVEFVAEALKHCWYENAGRYHNEFEQRFARYLGVQYSLALPSCTSAIHLALAALGIKPGDEVVVPEITWIASAAPISYLGATPVFADIDPVTWCLSPASLERAITRRTKAIIAVDLYGGMPDFHSIRDIALKHRIPLIEDAAQAIGSELNSQKAGTFGDVGVFSFHASKTITTGEGGMLVTNRKELYDRAYFLHDHGRARGDRTFFQTEVAYKYKMSGLQAALGIAQLERVEELVARKREIFAWYQDELGSDDRLALNTEVPGVKNSYWMTTAIVDARLGIEKTDLIRLLAERRVDSRPFFYPLSALPAYAHLESARHARDKNSVAYGLSRTGINLPSALNLTREQVVYVCEQVRDVLKAVQRHKAA